MITETAVTVTLAMCCHHGEAPPWILVVVDTVLLVTTIILTITAHLWVVATTEVAVPRASMVPQVDGSMYRNHNNLHRCNQNTMVLGTMIGIIIVHLYAAEVTDEEEKRTEGDKFSFADRLML